MQSHKNAFDIRVDIVQQWTNPKENLPSRNNTAIVALKGMFG